MHIADKLNTYFSLSDFGVLESDINIWSLPPREACSLWLWMGWWKRREVYKWSTAIIYAAHTHKNGVWTCILGLSNPWIRKDHWWPMQSTLNNLPTPRWPLWSKVDDFISPTWHRFCCLSLALGIISNYSRRPATSALNSWLCIWCTYNSGSNSSN